MRILVAFAAGFVLVQVAAPSWSHAMGLDVWALHQDVAFREEVNQKSRELDDQLGHLMRQVGAGHAVSVALIDGRITLDAAARQLAEINRDRLGFEDILRTVYQEDLAQRKLYAQYALHLVNTALASEPEKLKAVLARLEGEYNEIPAWEVD